MILASAFLNQLQSASFDFKPVYLLYGEEPLFLRECLDGLRHKLQTAGYLTGDFYEVDANFDWQSLKMETQAGSLFAENRMILISMPKGAPGKDGTQFIQDWCQYQQAKLPEMILVFQCERLDSRQTKAKWFSAVEAAGLVVQAKPVPANALPGWCQQKAQTLGLQLNSEAAAILAERVEGNLLAADQELLKLSLLFAPGSHINAQQVLDNVVDQAHYQLFALATAMLNGQVDYSLQILGRLKQEGIEAPIILWLVAKEIRVLVELALLAQQVSLAQAYNQLRIWQSKQAEYNRAMQRKALMAWQGLLKDALKIDLLIKGVTPTLTADEVWMGLAELITKVAR